MDINDSKQFFSLEPSEREYLLNWITLNLQQIKSENRRHTSYGLKHLFEDDKEQDGFYVNNGAFKGAMLEAGFTEFINGLPPNPTYNLSEKSISTLKKRRVR